MKNNRDQVLEQIRMDGNNLRNASSNLKKDKEIVSEAVKKNGSALQYADESLRKDKELVMKLVARKGMILKYADQSLKRDREVVLKAVKQDGYAIREVDNSLRKDREITLEAVKQYGKVLGIVDEIFKKDKEIVLEAIKTYENAIKYVDESMKKDRQVVLEAVKKNFFTLRYLNENYIKNDKELFIEALKQSEDAFSFASDSMRQDRQFVLELVKRHGLILGYVDGSLQKDREIALEAIRNNAKALKDVDKSLYSDIQFLYLLSKFCEAKAKEINPELFETIERSLKDNINTILSKDILGVYTCKFCEESDLYFFLQLQNHYPKLKSSIFILNTNYSSEFVEKMIILRILRDVSTINRKTKIPLYKNIDFHLFCFKIDRLLEENQFKMNKINFTNLRTIVEEVALKFDTSHYTEKEAASILRFYKEWTKDDKYFEDYKHILTDYNQLGGDYSKIIRVLKVFYQHYNNEYDIISVLGYGGEGVVFKAFCKKLKELVAIKIKFEKEYDRKSAMERITFLKRDDIEGKIKCHECDLIDNYIYSVMELGEETLQNYIHDNASAYESKLVSNDYLIEILSIFTKILESVQSIHDHNISHRDLDPKNIVKYRNQYKVIDFDIAKVIKTDKSITLTVGKYSYMSPEVSHDNYEDNLLNYNDKLAINIGSITTSCDLFSLGCILLELLTNCPLKLDREFLNDANIQKYDDKYCYFTEYGVYFHMVLTDLLREKKLHHAIQNIVDQFIESQIGKVNGILTRCIITMIQRDPSKRLSCFAHKAILTKVIEYLKEVNNLSIEEIENEMKDFKKQSQLIEKDLPQLMEDNDNLRQENYQLKQELIELREKVKDLERQLSFVKLNQ